MDPVTTTVLTNTTNAVIDPIATCLTNAIWRTVKYPFNVGANVRALQPAIDALTRRRNDVRMRVQTGERQGGRVREEVDGWMERVGDIENKVGLIKRKYESRGRCLGGLSLNCWSNYKISKNAAELLLEVNNTHEEGVGPNYQDPTMEAPPPAVQEVSIGSTSTQTTISNLELACEYINNSDVGVIGIWGMGGVGKTHLLEKINNSYQKNSPFNVVILVTASRDCSVAKIQANIVDMLKLPKESDENMQKNIIFNFLREKNFLLLLDDLWEELDLKKVGIPDLGLKDECKRKVVLTTRFLDVCGKMDVKKQIKVDHLKDNESFSLFREHLGNETLNSHPLIPSLAQKVVNELGGLPLALIIMGRAMYGKSNPAEWDYAINQLQASSSDELKRVCDQLKFSYQHLPNETLKKCFLFCSLFPEDDPLERNELIKSWIGLGYIEEPDIQKAYSRGHAIIGELLRRCLLEEYYDPNLDAVKMHDVIREMAHWIARDFGANKNKWVIKTGGLTRMPNDEKLWCDAEYISFMNNDFSVQSCSVLSSPSNLSTLLLPKNLLKISPINMSYVTNLRYLNLASNNISVIPPDICKLINLQYLDLSRNPIHSIPTELKALTNLKFLYMKWCNINSFPEGVILALKSLEVLDLFRGIYSSIVDNSFFVEELKSLKSLKALEISIDSSVLEKFNGLPLHSLFVNIPAVQGNLENKSFSINFNFSMETYIYLVYLLFHRGMGCKYFVIEGGQFPNLEKLIFFGMPDLIDIVWRGVLPTDVFPRLKLLQILCCDILEHITWIAQLPCLQILYVNSCNNIKELVRSNEESSSTSQQQSLHAFPSLKCISLHLLKKLESICDPDYYTFPSLIYLQIGNCPSLKKLPFPNGSIPPTVKYLGPVFDN